MAERKPKWNQPNGYHPHKTPSGAFDPEIFALPEMENLCPIDESGIISRTESLGLKCLADRPLLHAQMSTDSVFSRVTEGETMEPPDEDDSQENLESGAVSVASIPIGIRCPVPGPTPGHLGSDDGGAHSAPVGHHLNHDVPDDLVTEPFSMTSLPDRLACEETVNSMTAAVLQEDECQNHQIQTNNLFQMVNQGTAQILLVPSNQFGQSPMYQVNAAQVANAQMNVLYKTELCRSWQFGTCRYAERCLFAHGEHELRPLQRPRHNKYKTELCITYHSFGFCPYATRCNFVHEMGEHRPAKHSVPSLYKTRLCRTFMERGSCPYGDKCDFAHGTNDLSYDITKHPKYRTKLCRSFQETGTCIYGDRCCFSHSLTRPGPDLELSPSQPKIDQPVNTLQLKTNQSSNENPTSSKHQENNQAKKQICKRWKFTGKCPFGKHCIFSHNSTTPGKMAEKRSTPRG